MEPAGNAMFTFRLGISLGMVAAELIPAFEPHAVGRHIRGSFYAGARVTDCGDADFVKNAAR